MEIKISKKKNELLDEFYGIIVEQTISEKSRYLDSKNISSDLFKDFPNGVFGMREEIYEIPNQGTIIYQTPTEAITFENYIGIVKLLGFDEKKAKFSQKLKAILKKL